MKKILILALFLSFFCPTNTKAQTADLGVQGAVGAFKAMVQTGEITYQPLTTIPGITQINGTTGNPAEMITGFYRLAIGIAAIGAVIMIMWGGVEYMTTEAFTGKSNAKNRITYAFVGLILLLGSYIILNTINRDLITFKIGINGVASNETSTFLNQSIVDTKNHLEVVKSGIKNFASEKAQIIKAEEVRANTIRNKTEENKVLEDKKTELKKSGKTDDSPEVQTIQNTIKENEGVITATKKEQDVSIETEQKTHLDTKVSTTNDSVALAAVYEDQVNNTSASIITEGAGVTNTSTLDSNTPQNSTSAEKKTAQEKADYAFAVLKQGEEETKKEIETYIEKVNSSSLEQEKKDNLIKNLDVTKSYMSSRATTRSSYENVSRNITTKVTCSSQVDLEEINTFILDKQKQSELEAQKFESEGRGDLAIAVRNNTFVSIKIITTQISNNYLEKCVLREAKEKCISDTQKYEGLKDMTCPS